MVPAGPEQLCNRADESAIAERDVVATQDDEIRACGHCELDRLHDVARGDDSTVVNVGDETDAKTIEGGRQAGRPATSCSSCRYGGARTRRRT